MKLSFTVLINTYNYGHYVCRAIDSALEQDYADGTTEVLVIDDGSTDSTGEVVRNRYGDRIRYLRKERGGQASAFNLGFGEARGDVVCLLDADDFFYPNKLSLVARALSGRPEAGLVIDQFYIVDNNGHPLKNELPNRTWAGSRVDLDRLSSQLRSLILLGHPWSGIMSIRRDLLTGFRVPEEVSPHNPDLFLAIFLPFLTEVVIIEAPVTAYVYHGQNGTLFRSSKQNRDDYLVQLAHTRQIVEEHFGVKFLTYLGRSIYDVDMAPRPAFSQRIRQYLNESRQVTAAQVDAAIKLRSLLKLTACLLFPDPIYRGVRRLTA